MKHWKRGAALALSVLLALSLAGCGGGTAAGGGDTSAPAAETKGGPGTGSGTSGGTGGASGTDTSGTGTGSAAENVPGAPPVQTPGSFYAGTTVCFNNGAVTSSNDGVYFVPAADGSAADSPAGGAFSDDTLLLVPDDLIYDTSICTDGSLVYYVSAWGELMEAVLGDGPADTELRQVTNGIEFPFGAGVVGAGRDRVYVQTPGPEDEDGIADLDSVVTISLETGELLDTWEWCEGAGCAEGYTAIYGAGYDVSPRELLIYDADGVETVNEAWSMGASVSGGKLWYTAVSLNEDGGMDSVSLYRMEPDGPVEAVTREVASDTYSFGIHLNGFLASEMYSDGDGNFGYHVWDVRTGEAVDLGEQSWYGGYTAGGQDFLAGADRIYRMEDHQLVFTLHPDLRDSTLYLCGGTVFADGPGGEFYAFPLNGDAEAAVLPVTATYSTLEEYDGKNGATVIGYYPQLLTENLYTWSELAEALAEYNQDAMDRTRGIAADCAEMASRQIEDGFAAPNDFFSAYTRAYIQRCDDKAFTFVEHQTMDNRVNQAALDIKTGYNFDPSDGHALSLDEIVTDVDGLADAVLAEMEDTGTAEREELEEFLFQLFKNRSLTSTPGFSFVLGYEGLSLYLNGNVNFPYGQGSFKCYISFTDHPELFNPRYFAVPDAYAYDILLDDYFSEEYRLESDGGAVRFLTHLLRDDTGLVSGISGVLDGSPATEPGGGSPAFGTIVHYCGNGTGADGMAAAGGSLRAGGRNYLCVQYGGDGMELDTYALDGQFAQLYEFGDGALPQHMPLFPEAEGYGSEWNHAWFGNPAAFSILLYDGIGAYANRVVYDFRDGSPVTRDLFYASAAVG